MYYLDTTTPNYNMPFVASENIYPTIVVINIEDLALNFTNSTINHDYSFEVDVYNLLPMVFGTIQDYEYIGVELELTLRDIALAFGYEDYTISREVYSYCTSFSNLVLGIAERLKRFNLYVNNKLWYNPYNFNGIDLMLITHYVPEHKRPISLNIAERKSMQRIELLKKSTTVKI